MCIKRKIAELQQEIDAKIKLKSLLEKTQPLLTSISVVCSDYRELAPEELPFLIDEILQAAQVDLSVAAISAIAAKGDEKAQNFAVDAMAQTIDLLPVPTPEDELVLDNDEVTNSEEAPNLMERFLIASLPLPHLKMWARVTPAIGDGKFTGATFTFYRSTSDGIVEELFNSSETAEQIARGENNPELIAVSLASGWLKRQELKNLPPAGTTHTEPPTKDEFTELVYLSDAVAYLKRKDNGEVLTAYLGFSNKTAEGDRAPTMAKSRASKWQEHLVGVYQLACSGPRECQRIESKNPKMPFKYELKLIKPSMGQLQGLATENFGLYPNEVEEKQQGQGSEARNELLTPPTEIKFSDFEFERADDFDELNPEFSVKYRGEYLTRIWSSLRTTTAGQQPQRLWRHRLLKPGEEIELKDTEAVTLHALQRSRGLA